MGINEEKHIISTECGDLSVFVQGDITQQEKKAVFLTVHDLGCNHSSFHDFLEHPAMVGIRDRSILVHVDVPGHEDNAPTLPESYVFPRLTVLGESLINVLNTLKIKYVIGLGEGAGANVLARFGIAHPSRLLGLILINCTGSAATVKDTIKNKYMSWTGKENVSQSTEDFLMYHKFGHKIFKENYTIDKEKIIDDFRKKLHGPLNNRNLLLYVQAFLSRTDLSLKDCHVDILLITGLQNTYSSVVEKLFKDMNKEKTTLLKIEQAGDVMIDAPSKVAQSILLFCKGQGLLSSVMMPGVDNPRRLSRGMSMEDYDKPNIRRLSLIPNTSNAN